MNEKLPVIGNKTKCIYAYAFLFSVNIYWELKTIYINIYL